MAVDRVNSLKTLTFFRKIHEWFRSAEKASAFKLCGFLQCHRDLCFQPDLFLHWKLNILSFQLEILRARCSQRWPVLGGKLHAISFSIALEVEYFIIPESKMFTEVTSTWWKITRKYLWINFVHPPRKIPLLGLLQCITIVLHGDLSLNKEPKYLNNNWRVCLFLGVW